MYCRTSLLCLSSIESASLLLLPHPYTLMMAWPASKGVFGQGISATAGWRHLKSFSITMSFSANRIERTANCTEEGLAPGSLPLQASTCREKRFHPVDISTVSSVAWKRGLRSEETPS